MKVVEEESTIQVDSYWEQFNLFFTHAFHTWSDLFIEKETLALGIEIDDRRYASNCSYSNLYLGPLLRDRFEFFKDSKDPVDSVAGTHWRARNMGSVDISPFGEFATQSGHVCPIYSRPFENEFSGQKLPPCVFLGYMPCDTFNQCYEVILSVNPHSHPEDAAPTKDDKRSWSLCLGNNWKFTVFGKFANPFPTTTCSDNTVYFKGDFVYVPLFTDKLVLAEPVGNSSDEVCSFIRSIFTERKPGCGLTMNEIYQQLDRSWYFNPSLNYAQSKLSDMYSCGMSNLDAQNYFFSCTKLQNYPWNSPRDPDECDAEALSEAIRPNGSFVLGVPMQAIEQAVVQKFVRLKLDGVSSIHDIFNTKLTCYSKEDARINSVVLFQLLQSHTVASYNTAVGENEILHSNLLKQMRVIPAWKMVRTRFTFEGLLQPLVVGHAEHLHKVIGTIPVPVSTRIKSDSDVKASSSPSPVKTVPVLKQPPIPAPSYPPPPAFAWNSLVVIACPHKPFKEWVMINTGDRQPRALNPNEKPDLTGCWRSDTFPRVCVFGKHKSNSTLCVDQLTKYFNASIEPKNEKPSREGQVFLSDDIKLWKHFMPMASQSLKNRITPEVHKKPLRIVICMKQLIGYIRSLSDGDSYTIRPRKREDGKKTYTKKGDWSWLLGPIQVTDEITDGIEHFNSAVDLYLMYLKGYFGGAFNISDAPVVVVPHDEWLNDPKSVVNTFQVLGLPRNSVSFEINTVHTKDKNQTRDMILQRNKSVPPSGLVEAIGTEVNDRCNFFYSTGLDPIVPKISPVVSKAPPTKPSQPPTHTPKLQQTTPPSPPSSIAPSNSAGSAEGSSDRTQAYSCLGAGPAEDFSSQAQAISWANLPPPVLTNAHVMIDLHQKHWTQYENLVDAKWIKTSRSWCYKLVDPRTGKIFMNPRYSSQEADADPTKSIKVGQARPEGHSSWLGYMDAYRASRSVRYAVDRAFAEVIVAHPEWYVGEFPYGFLRQEFLLQLDIICTTSTKTMKDFLGQPKVAPSNSAALLDQHPLRRYIKDQHLSAPSTSSGPKPSSAPPTPPMPTKLLQSTTMPPPPPPKRGDKRQLSRDEPREPISVEMRSGPQSSSTFSRISHGTGASNLKLAQNSTSSSSTRNRPRKDYSQPTDWTKYQGVDYSQIPTRRERLRDEPQPRGREPYRLVENHSGSRPNRFQRVTHELGRGGTERKRNWQPIREARSDDRSRTPTESELKAREPRTRADGCVET